MKEPPNQPLQRSEKRRNWILSGVGIILLLLSLAAFIFVKSIPGLPIPTGPPISRIVPSQILAEASGGGGGGGGGGGCTVTESTLLTFTIIQGQSEHASQPVKLTPCGAIDPWSGKLVSSQAASWLSLSPTQGVLREGETQSVSITVSASYLNEGSYTGRVRFTSKYSDVTGVDVDVSVEVVSQFKNPIKDIVAYTPLSDLTVVATLPRLIKSQAADLTVSLLSSRNLLSTMGPPWPESVQEPSMSPTLGAGVYNLLLKDAYQPVDYQLKTLVTQLDAATFDISPSTLPPQTPYQRIVSFHWNIVPKEAGHQSLALDIAGQWQPKGGGELQTIYFLLAQFSVNVDDSPVPFLTFGQLTLGEFLFALLGSILNVPWILDYIHKRREKGQRKQKAPLSRSNTPPKSRKLKRRPH